MNKFGMVMSLAAAAAITGCLDPDYKRPVVHITPVPVVVKPAEPEPQAPVEAEPQAKPVETEVKPVEVQSEPVVTEEVLPKEEVKVVEKKPAPAPEAAYTVYVVQNGDALSKISKKYNVKVSAIKELNGLKDDRIRIGQKLKLPGRVEVSAAEQKAPEPKKAAAPAPKVKTTATTVYKGGVKEYVVKKGDTLGGIAFANGISVRQLKALNKLTSDNLSIGQKLQVPAEKVQKADKNVKSGEAKKQVETKADTQQPVVGKADAAPAGGAVVEPDAPKNDDAKADPAVIGKTDVKEDPVQQPQPELKLPDANPDADAAETYVVQDGDDVMAIAVRFNTSSSAIRELNNLSEDDKISVGTVLKLPPDAVEGD